MRVLGVDPGSRITGYGLVELDSGRARYVASGCIKTRGDDFPARLADIYRGIETLIFEFTPTEFAIEDVFLAKNPQSALKLGQARGVAIAAAVASNLPVSEYAARFVKKAIVGTGRANKAQVQLMVRTLLQLESDPAVDAADALAIALCHSNSRASPFPRLGTRL